MPAFRGLEGLLRARCLTGGTPALSERLGRLMALGLGCALMAGAGCGRHRPQGDVSALEITRYRMNVDEEHETVHLIAEVSNMGEQPVREALVTARLQGPADSEYASAQTLIKSVAPGRPQVFSLRIPANGRERDVAFTISPPEYRTKRPERPAASP